MQNQAGRRDLWACYALLAPTCENIEGARLGLGETLNPYPNIEGVCWWGSPRASRPS